MARHEVNPIEDWESEELSEEELDLLAGGFDPGLTGSVEFKPIDLKFPAPDPPVKANTDSSYSSFLGAQGANKNEASLHQPILPLNITNKFP